MGARAAMVAALQQDLPADVRVVPDPRNAGDTLAAKLRAMVQVVLVAVEPATTAGQLKGTFEIWVVVPFQDPAAGEEKLESAFDIVLELLLKLNWFAFEKATRSTYSESKWLCYKFDGYSQLTTGENEDG